MYTRKINHGEQNVNLTLKGKIQGHIERLSNQHISQTIGQRMEILQKKNYVHPHNESWRTNATLTSKVNGQGNSADTIKGVGFDMFTHTINHGNKM